jgi:hypothetical protein
MYNHITICYVCREVHAYVALQVCNNTPPSNHTIHFQLHIEDNAQNRHLNGTSQPMTDMTFTSIVDITVALGNAQDFDASMTTATTASSRNYTAEAATMAAMTTR